MNRLRTTLAAAAATLAAGPGQAQHVGECDWLASAWMLAEPWEQNSRIFANGDVRVALIDAIEPGAVPFHLLVLSPPWDELGARQCRVLSLEPGIGFSGVNSASLEARYDPAAGLLFSVPISVYDGVTGDFGDRGLNFTLNQATGEIAAALD